MAPGCLICSDFHGPTKKTSISHLKASAERGCDGCRLLANAIHGLDVYWRHLFSSQAEAEKQVTIEVPPHRLVYEPGSKWFRIEWPLSPQDRSSEPSSRSSKRSCPPAHISWRKVRHRILNSLGGRIHEEKGFAETQTDTSGVRKNYLPLVITSSEPNPLPWKEFAVTDHIASHSAAESCFKLLRSWLEECSLNHPACRKSPRGASAAPKRLIDIGSPNKDPQPKLVDSCTDALNYVALSHCWGNSKQFQTTKETYEQMLVGFTFDHLPRTFQDAMRICQKLGIRYLWIDSICIMQQDIADWEAEVPRMGEIYGNAHLVISASLADGPDCGCFAQKPPANIFAFEYDGSTSSVCARKKISHYAWAGDSPYSTDTNLPLLSRGWAFQERLLSRRMVHYTIHELVWECRSRSWCECNKLGSRGNSDVSLKSMYAEVVTDTEMTPEETPRLSRSADIADTISSDLQSRIWVWNKIVEHFSIRDFTVDSDRLPALSSIAKQIHVPEMGDYLAGIWSGSLPDALDWCPRGSSRITYPKAYGVPSWSWASLEQGVDLNDSSRFSPANYSVRVVEARCTPASNDPYGAGSDGYVIVEGEIGLVDCDSFRNGRRYGTYRKVRATDRRSSEGEHFALKMCEIGNSDLRDYTECRWQVLLLKKSTRVENSYERIEVGLVEDDFFNRSGRYFIRIV